MCLQVVVSLFLWRFHQVGDVGGINALNRRLLHHSFLKIASGRRFVVGISVRVSFPLFVRTPFQVLTMFF